MSSIPNSSMEEEGEKTRSTIELFKTEMLEQVVENKLRIDLLNEQLEINERKVRDLQATINLQKRSLKFNNKWFNTFKKKQKVLSGRSAATQGK
jgi:hypothetical protein